MALTPLRVAVVVVALHAAWIGAYLVAGHEPRDFIKIGTSYLAQSDASSVIRFDPTYDYPANRDPDFAGRGYDGQFSYFMALDFRNAHEYTDVPSYRYGRVLYPLLARGLALGRAPAIPWTLILVNWLAVAGGTLLLADWLGRRACPPWYALLFGLYPGVLLAVQRDLTEPLAYALVMAGVWALDLTGRRAIAIAALAFGLAGLARQTTIVFPLCWALAALAAGRRREAAVLAAGGVLPMAIYNAIVLAWLGPDSAAPWPQPVPFRGLFEGGWTWTSKPVQIVTVVVPALLFAAAVIALARRRGWRVEHVCYLANAALFVALVRPDLYLAWTALGRQSTPMVLAAALCLPSLREAAPSWRA
jgi:hypothetical protein